MDYKQKYLKYKKKFLTLKKLIGGVIKSTESNIHPLLVSLTSDNSIQQKIDDLTRFLIGIYLTKDHKILVLTTINNYFVRKLNNLNADQRNFELISNLIYLVLSNITTPENNIGSPLVRTFINELQLVKPYIEAKLRTEITRLRAQMTVNSRDHERNSNDLTLRLSMVTKTNTNYHLEDYIKELEEKIEEENQNFEIKQNRLIMEVTLYENILGI